MLKAAGVAGAAAWVAPSVLSVEASAATTSNCACTATTSAQFLTAQADVNPRTAPTACGLPTTGATATLTTFCRANSGQAIYLWGSGTEATGTNGPLFDDIGVVTVTENRTGGVTRYGNIYRFQNYCRHGTVVPTVGPDPTYSTAVQRVYTGTDANTWDYLPPQPASNPAETATPTSWWAASQPGTAPNSVGNPGYNTATPWPGPVDISYLFGNNCGTFTVTVENRNRYVNYKWSNIFVGSTHP